MLYKPSELPRGEDAIIDPALRRILNWRDPQLVEAPKSPDPAVSIAFVQENAGAISANFREVIAMVAVTERGRGEQS